MRNGPSTAGQQAHETPSRGTVVTLLRPEPIMALILEALYAAVDERGYSLLEARDNEAGTNVATRRRVHETRVPAATHRYWINNFLCTLLGTSTKEWGSRNLLSYSLRGFVGSQI